MTNEKRLQKLTQALLDGKTLKDKFTKQKHKLINGFISTETIDSHFLLSQEIDYADVYILELKEPPLNFKEHKILIFEVGKRYKDEKGYFAECKEKNFKARTVVMLFEGRENILHPELHNKPIRHNYYFSGTPFMYSRSQPMYKIIKEVPAPVKPVTCGCGGYLLC